MKKDLRATWPQALLTFLSPILVIMTLRWLLIEPYIIPSGSMIPTLLINDNVLVNKLSFGVKVPFGNTFIVKWGSPQRGEIVVFRWPENPQVFFIKRILAVAGDRIAIDEGRVFINGVEIPQAETDFDGAEEGFDYFQEKIEGVKPYTVRYRNKELSSFAEYTVPENSFFVVGDNRDQSNDSRFWGVVSEENLIGRASLVWLSCEETLASARVLCNPKTLRSERIFKFIQ